MGGDSVVVVVVSSPLIEISIGASLVIHDINSGVLQGLMGF